MPGALPKRGNQEQNNSNKVFKKALLGLAFVPSDASMLELPTQNFLRETAPFNTWDEARLIREIANPYSMLGRQYQSAMIKHMVEAEVKTAINTQLLRDSAFKRAIESAIQREKRLEKKHRQKIERMKSAENAQLKTIAENLMKLCQQYETLLSLLAEQYRQYDKLLVERRKLEGELAALMQERQTLISEASAHFDDMLERFQEVKKASSKMFESNEYKEAKEIARKEAPEQYNKMVELEKKREALLNDIEAIQQANIANPSPENNLEFINKFNEIISINSELSKIAVEQHPEKESTLRSYIDSMDKANSLLRPEDAEKAKEYKEKLSLIDVNIEAKQAELSQVEKKMEDTLSEIAKLNSQVSKVKASISAENNRADAIGFDPISPQAAAVVESKSAEARASQAPFEAMEKDARVVASNNAAMQVHIEAAPTAEHASTSPSTDGNIIFDFDDLKSAYPELDSNLLEEALQQLSELYRDMSDDGISSQEEITEALEQSISDIIEISFEGQLSNDKLEQLQSHLKEICSKNFDNSATQQTFRT